MKLNKKFLLKIGLIFAILGTTFLSNTNAGIVNLGGLDGIDKVQETTINKTGSGDIVKDTEDFGFSILQILKVILEGVLLIYIVYIGGTMIMSMGSDDAKLTNAKNQLWYSLVAIVFINIPGQIFNTINQGTGERNINGGEAGEQFRDDNSDNLFLNFDLFGDGILNNILSAIQVLILIIGVYVMIMAGIKIMTSRGRDEKVTEAKGKMIYSIFALIFVGFIEAWKQFAITGNLSIGSGIFGKAANIALLFAGPIVIAFLTYAGYIYITANGNEDKVKKAKNIVVNTLIAIVLLTVMFTFLNDLITL